MNEGNYIKVSPVGRYSLEGMFVFVDQRQRLTQFRAEHVQSFVFGHVWVEEGPVGAFEGVAGQPVPVLEPFATIKGHDLGQVFDVGKTS